MRRWLTMMAGGLCLAVASSVLALGVGDPQQVSPLNRPLHVVLPLTDAGGLSVSRISVAVADAEAYRQAGLTRDALADTVSAKAVRQDGELTLVLDSPRRVREPFLDLLLVVTWPDGQWQRGVSLLFDPVDYASSQPLLDGDVSVSSGQATISPLSAPMPVRTAIEAPHAWPARLRVQPGDSLSGLAASLLPRAGISRQALMVALFQSNPAAFIDGDIGRLRAGVDLTVPALDVVAGLSRGDAVTRLRALLGRAGEERSLVDIAGQRPASHRVGTMDGPRSATPEQRLAELTAATERQRETIDALRAERDELRGALAATASPSVDQPAGAVTPREGPMPGSPSAGEQPDEEKPDGEKPVGEQPDGTASAVSDPAVAEAASSATPVASGKVASGAETAMPAASSPGVARASVPPASMGGALVDHLDWIGGGVLVVLLALWGLLRRRRQAGGEGLLGADEASPSRAKGARAKCQTAKASPLRRASAGDGDADSVSISQADIYMAYGRHAEARDWLRHHLAEREDAQLRLGLLRALGELRDMDALEVALSGFGADATPEQRREGQALVDDYRARHVEESWQEATGDGIGQEGDREWLAEVEDVDALFEAQALHTLSDGDLDKAGGVATSETPPSRLRGPRSDTDAIHRQDSWGKTEAERRDAVSVSFDDEAIEAFDVSAASPLVARIDYEAPTLELETERADAALSSSTAKPVADFSGLSLASTSLESPSLDTMAHPLEPAKGPSGASGKRESGNGAMGSRGPAPESPENRADDSRIGLAGDAPGYPGIAGSASRLRGDGASGPRREVPAGRDVEEVEFRSSHRDNGRP
ncbi:MAG: hypothetical protein HRU39_12550 [Salinicola sp.]|uniref:type IV pilus assembly protein FimV n=1 Tax=Salinicola sp. TaxID=1978524 RepID=UPI001D73C30D|nr:hypothetical protein [Salinicola sp.]NRB56789.1 hypothetical protein [Salinicola sp.]